MFRALRSQVAALPVSEFNALWREYVAAFGDLIRQADHDARSAAAMHLVGQQNIMAIAHALCGWNARVKVLTRCAFADLEPPVTSGHILEGSMGATCPVRDQQMAQPRN